VEGGGEDSILTYDDSIADVTQDTIDTALLGTNKRKQRQDKFMKDLEAKVELAKSVWNKKVENFKRTLKLDEMEEKMGWRDRGARTFGVVIKLHCYENVILELEECYELDPASIIFYIPQLVTYFLYSAYQNSSELEAFLLDKCSRNVHFSHRMFWFLRAWCVRTSVAPGSKEESAILDLMREVKRRGEGPASLLMVGQGPGEDVNALVKATEGAIGGSGGYQGGQVSVGSVATRKNTILLARCLVLLYTINDKLTPLSRRFAPRRRTTTTTGPQPSPFSLPLTFRFSLKLLRGGQTRGTRIA